MVGGSSTRFSSEAHLRIGRWLRSKWHLDSLIAIGGMASVYAGTHRNGARAAIKVLHAQYTRNEQARRRFLAEGYAANKVGHRNAVSVLDDDITEDGEVYLVMELLEGESFEGRLDRVGIMEPIECLQITEQMLEVLACAHTRGILHRDIKPANVFLCRDGSVKLLDFGLARVRELSAEALDQSDGIVFGTVSYIAPEQARADNQNLDARSDMWSVAATMFRALTGETVFPAEGPVIERLMAVARKPARSLGAVAPRLPRLVIELVDRALAFDPDNRWPSANVMRVVVQDVLAQLTEEAEKYAPPPPPPDDDEIRFSSPIFRKQPNESQTSRPRSEPAMQSPRPKVDPLAAPIRAAAPMRPRTDPDLAVPPQAQRPARPKTDPFGVSADELRDASESQSGGAAADEDEVDLDVDSLQGPQSKRNRARTLLTKEGRAELRRILDARRATKAKGDPTPEPVQVQVPTPTQPAVPTPTPTPAPIQSEVVLQAPRKVTEPSPVAAVQPVRRKVTEPSPVASPVLPRPRTVTEPSPAAPSPMYAGASSIGMASDSEGSNDEGSMLESGMVVMQPEESIIELTIQHTRSSSSGGAAAEPNAEATRPGPADSMRAAFPTIGGPSSARAGGSAAPEPTSKTTGSYPTIGSVPPTARVGGSTAAPATPGPTSKTTESYPTIGNVPPAPSKTTGSYPAIGATRPPAKPPQRDEATRTAAAPQPPTGARAMSDPKPTALPVPTPVPVRAEEPAVDVTKVTRIPLPSFGKPAAPVAPAPGPLPSRAGLPTQAGDGGDVERKPMSSSGRWAPPTKVGSPGETKPSAKASEPVKFGLPTAKVESPPVKQAAPVKVEPVKSEPVKQATPVKVEPSARPEPVKSPVVKSDPPVVKSEPPKTPVVKSEPPKTVTPSKPPSEPSKPVVAKPEAAKPVIAKPTTSEVKTASKPAPTPEVKAPVKVDAPAKVPAPVKTEAAKPVEVAKKVEPVKPEPERVAEPEPTPAPDPVRLPGAGLSRPAPTKSVFSVPYSGLGKSAERSDKATAKPEPQPAKGTPKKSS